MYTKQQFKSINEKENISLQLGLKKNPKHNRKPKHNNKTKKPREVSKQAIQNTTLCYSQGTALVTGCILAY